MPYKENHVCTYACAFDHAHTGTHIHTCTETHAYVKIMCTYPHTQIKYNIEDLEGYTPHLLTVMNSGCRSKD